MSIADLIDLLSRRLVNLSQARAAAADLGDVSRIDSLDAEIAETETTLGALRAI
jgi:hypothetical protein